MFIRELTVKNFMVHRSTSLELFPLTVFVGANNSGKSALFESLLNLSEVSKGALNSTNDFMGVGPYSFRGRSSNAANQAEAIGYEVKVAPTPDAPTTFSYRIAYRQTDWDGTRAYYEITEENLRNELDDQLLVDRSAEPPVWPSEISGPKDDQTILASVRELQSGAHPELEAFGETVTQIGKFKLDPKLMRQTGAYSPNFSTGGLKGLRLGYGGEYLAGLLYTLYRRQLDEYEEILESLGNAIDGFRRFRFNEDVPPNKDTEAPNVGLRVQFRDSRGLVDAPNLSDGTLLLIGWITLLSLPKLHRVLMLEEPEVGLTPAATRSIFNAIDDVSQREEGAQVLVSTHSPYLLAWARQREGGDQRSYVLSQQDGQTRATTVAESLEIREKRIREKSLEGPPSSFNSARGSVIDVANELLESLESL